MKLIIYNECTGNIARIGLYTDDNKWVRWLSKKDLDKYVEQAYSVENKTYKEVIDYVSSGDCFRFIMVNTCNTYYIYKIEGGTR